MTNTTIDSEWEKKAIRTLAMWRNPWEFIKTRQEIAHITAEFNAAWDAADVAYDAAVKAYDAATDRALFILESARAEIFARETK